MSATTNCLNGSVLALLRHICAILLFDKQCQIQNSESEVDRSHLWREGWTLAKADEKRIKSAEMLIYRRMLRVSWTEHQHTKVFLQSLKRNPPIYAIFTGTSVGDILLTMILPKKL